MIGWKSTSSNDVGWLGHSPDYVSDKNDAPEFEKMTEAKTVGTFRQPSTDPRIWMRTVSWGDNLTGWFHEFTTNLHGTHLAVVEDKTGAVYLIPATRIRFTDIPRG